MWSTSVQQPDLLDRARLAHGRGRRYGWAAASGALARAAGPALSLLITPYALAKLGPQRYGLFALALMLSGWLALLDPGLAPGLRVVLARRSAKLDAARLAPLLGAAAMGQRALAAVVLAGGVALAFVAPSLLAIPTELQADAELLFLCIAAGTAALVFSRHYAAALDACQLAAAERAIRLGQNVLRMLALAALLALGWGLESAGWSYLLAAVAAMLALSLACRRLLPELPWSAAANNRAGLAELLRPGAWLSAGAVAGVLIVGVDRAVVARLVSLEAVTTFALTSAAFLLAEAMLTPAVDAARPALAQALGAGRREEARRIYLRLATAAAALGPIGALAILAANRAFVTAWAGAPSYGGLALDLSFALAFVVNLWSLPHRALLTADLRARESTLWRMAEGGLNLAASIALCWRFGPAGVAAGTALAALLTSCWALPMLAASSADISAGAALRPLLSALALLATLGPAAFLARDAAAAGGFLAAAAAAAAIAGAASALWWRIALTSETRQSWIQLARQLLRRRRRAWSAA